jgi:hypothetical protein
VSCSALEKDCRRAQVFACAIDKELDNLGMCKLGTFSVESSINSDHYNIKEYPSNHRGFATVSKRSIEHMVASDDVGIQNATT